jgi:osmotically-inducible protein OsmY
MSLVLAVPRIASREHEIKEGLSQRIQAVLRGCPHRPLSAVCVDVDGSDVRLSGSVRSYYEKQLAQSAAMKVPGISRLRNELQVVATGEVQFA